MIRVYPRDLFNDANLLKCIGQLSLHELDNKLPKGWGLDIPQPYEIEQYESNGSTFIVGMTLTDPNRLIMFERPLNSREAWPLMGLELGSERQELVFNDQGEFTKEFLNLLTEE